MATDSLPDAVYVVLRIFFEFTHSFGLLVLATVGLAVIFGMMGIINLAHGEFILIGAYGTTLSFHAGLPLPLAMVTGVAVTTVVGLILERTVIRHLYDRLLDSMVATFGLSLVIIQLTRILFGNTTNNVSLSMGSISYGPYSSGTYRILLAVIALVVLAVLYWVFTRTKFGLRARATMQDAETARAMGVNTDRMYMLTFGLGAALAGLTGALFTPAFTVDPEIGSEFLVESFVTVVVGGPSVLIGTSLGGALLGTIDAMFTWIGGSFLGEIMILIAAIIAIRIMPEGITGLLEDWRQKRREDE
ncbi:urea ABC transporter, permease protein UrtB [Halostagnicola bangensis]